MAKVRTDLVRADRCCVLQWSPMSEHNIPPAQSRKGIGGRPTKYTTAKAKLICSGVAAGQTLKQIAEALSINYDTIHEWRNSRPEFSDMLAQARFIRAEHMADEIVEISDESSADWIEWEMRDGQIRGMPNPAAAARARLRVETRKFLMEKWAPKQFGSLQRLELTGAGGGPILLEQITLVAMRELEAERVSAHNGPRVIDNAGERPEQSALTHTSAHTKKR
jgi:hypothetical protein